MYSWMKDYLTNRQQYVSLQHVCSSSLCVTCGGVSRGSVLGPLLLLIHVNDTGNVLINKTAELFADDTNIYILHQDISMINIMANECMFSLSQWFIANRLSLNIDKTCLITLKYRIMLS